MCRRGALTLVLFLFVVAIFLLAPQRLLADGGHGTGITFPAATPAGETTDTTINFSPYKDTDDQRIRKDFNLLLSDSVVARMTVVEGNIQGGVNKLLGELDYVRDNEFDLPYHDFALVYNYFARPDTLYGQRVRDDGANVLFNLDYPDSQENHVDLYLAGYWAEQSEYGWAGVYPSSFWDWDEDSTSFNTTCHLNSLQDYDGPNGLEKHDPDWYKSGGACNVRFSHEFQHMCNRSSTGSSSCGWPNEMLSTAAEYLAGVSEGSSFWEPMYDIPCDANLTGWIPNPCHWLYLPYGMWRLFAAYLLHQFNTDESEYTDDLLYKWVSNWPSYASEGVLSTSFFFVRRSPV